jgi:L-gulonate 5-dehydrogenase
MRGLCRDAQRGLQPRHRGVIVHIGLGEDEGGLDIRRMTLQEITFIGTYTYTAQDFRDTAHAMFDGAPRPA